jgi:hypothetical protein
MLLRQKLAGDGGISSNHGKISTDFYLQNLDRRDYMSGIGIEARIILRTILQEMMQVCR